MLLLVLHYARAVPNPEFPREELFHAALGTELRIAATDIGLTIPEVAEAAGMSVHTVRRVMKHSRPAGVLELIQLARVLHLDFASVCERALERAFVRQREMEQFERSAQRNIG